MSIAIGKQVILDILKKSIHNLLSLCDDQNEMIIEDSHITQSFCSSIEAMFLHGEISTQSSGILSRFGRTKQSYEYDFKNFIIEYVPRNLLQVLENHTLKLTPIGFSRVWLRLTLNESTILSYLESMIKDEKRLKRYYSKESLIRDEELMEAFCGLLKSIEHLSFNLDTSLPLLNTWVNSDALQIVGLQHHATSKSELNQSDYNMPVNSLYSSMSNADEKIESFNLTNEEEILPTNIMSIRIQSGASVTSKDFSFPSSAVHPISLEDNDNHSDSGTDSDIYEDTTTTEKTFTEENEIMTKEITHECVSRDMALPSIDRDLESHSLDLNGFDDKQSLKDTYISKEFDATLTTMTNKDVDKYFNSNVESNENNLNLVNQEVYQNSAETKIVQDSFDKLWSHYNLSSTDEVDIQSPEKSPELQDNIIFDNCEIADDIEPSKVYSSFIIKRVIASTAYLINNISERRFPYRFFKVKESEQPWVFIGDDLLSRNTDLKKLMDMFPGVSESSSRLGENSVFGGLCHKCHGSLETNKVFLDYYDGQLYCFSCESETKAIIPRDVISNWDFNPKSVSKTTKRFLSEIMVHPNINLASNSCLFEVVPELSRVRKLRHKLSLLWLQVTSCDIETSTKVREAMFPREYMLASVMEKDLYSLEDLIMLHNGVLEKTLLYVIDKIAIPHVNKCMVCRMKALACDNCRDKNNLIYIHEIDCYCECSTPLCQSVVHYCCMKSGTKSFYCRRCIQYLETHQPITLASYDTADTND